MEFWGVEVKAGESLNIQPEPSKLIHISQASLGVVKDAKSAKNVHLRLKIDGKDFIIGSLAAEERAQLMFDLVFEKEFSLSHDWKNGSVYFLGYTAEDLVSDDEGFPGESDDESEDEVLAAHENGVAELKSGIMEAAKNAAAAEAESDEDEDESDSDDDNSEDDSEEEESEEELPKVQSPKKRPAQAAQKPNAHAAKKAKPAQAQKGPSPSKPAGKPQGGNKFRGGKKR